MGGLPRAARALSAANTLLASTAAALLAPPFGQGDGGAARQQHHDQGGRADRMTVQRDNEGRAGVDDCRGKLD